MKPCTLVAASVQQPSECSWFLLILVKGVNAITRTHTRVHTHTPPPSQLQCFSADDGSLLIL